MNSTKYPTKDVPIARLFPYRKRTVYVSTGTRVGLYGLNWDSGSRSEYALVHIASRRIRPMGDHMAAPWDNKDEGREVQIPEGFAVVKTGTFRGQPGGMFITVHPDSVNDLFA